jgi:hypothetical protein
MGETVMRALYRPEEISNAYKRFDTAISEGGLSLKCRIGHRARTDTLDLVWHEALRFWVCLQPVRQPSRYWCAFGKENPRIGTVSIGCEINPSKHGADRRCAGLFVVGGDGATYLAHSGKIGGGRPGIGKEMFLKHRKGRGIGPVQFPNGEFHDYLIVGRIGDAHFRRDVAEFIRDVDVFKNA